MSGGNYTHTTRGSGTILTAAIYNADHVNHITNQSPQGTGGYSDDVAQMQLTVNPGGIGSESLTTSLAGELERIRFAIDRIVGKTQWYEAPAASLEDVAAGGIDDNSVTNAKLADMAPNTIKARWDDTPAGGGDPQDTAIDSTLRLSSGSMGVASGGITTTQLADAAVTASKIVAGAVGTTELANNAVTDAKIAFGIDGDKIAEGTITTGELANDTVTTSKLANNAVTKAKLATGVLGNATTFLNIATANMGVQSSESVFPGSVIMLNAPGTTQVVNLINNSNAQFTIGDAILVYANQSGLKAIRGIESQTVVSIVGSSPDISAQRGFATVMKIGNNLWAVGGNIA